jgi:CheY-like chemotaxis protein
VSSRKTEGDQATVLVVDDDVDFLEVMREIIEEEKFRVLTAGNGEEALRILESGETPCLIILDLKMPGMDGPEFRRRQLRHPRLAEIPVVGFTGAANGESEARRLALTSFLRKPVHLHHLLETVAHYCSDPDHIDSSSRPASAAR